MRICIEHASSLFLLLYSIAVVGGLCFFDYNLFKCSAAAPLPLYLLRTALNLYLTLNRTQRVSLMPLCSNNAWGRNRRGAFLPMLCNKSSPESVKDNAPLSMVFCSDTFR